MRQTLLLGLLGGGFGAAIIMLAAPADLFGRVPALVGHIAAPAEHVAVVDGQTLRLHDTVLRLQGVEVPARGQACGGNADCGAEASRKLAALIRGRDVACQLDGRDNAGFLQAQCTAGTTRLNAAMAEQPWPK